MYFFARSALEYMKQVRNDSLIIIQQKKELESSRAEVNGIGTLLNVCRIENDSLVTNGKVKDETIMGQKKVITWETISLAVFTILAVLF